jgi:anhydro-N-acetylmuramic acid kinase
MLLSYILIPKKLAYDDKGNLARTGNIDAALLAALNQIDYYSRPYPKSLGYEWFCDQVKPIITAYKGTVEDALNTSIHHIAIQIASALKTYGRKGAKLLITGGGAKNSFLIETLAIFLGQDFTVEVPDDKIIDFKEALIFAFMGVLKERNEINSLKSVTGAKSDASSGVIYKPCSS